MYTSSQRSEDAVYHDWANELISYLVAQSSEVRGSAVAAVRSTYSDMSDKQIINALHETYLPLHPAYRYGFAAIDAKYKPDEQRYSSDLFFYY